VWGRKSKRKGRVREKGILKGRERRGFRGVESGENKEGKEKRAMRGKRREQ
jgi:hypothetical protein